MTESTAGTTHAVFAKIDEDFNFACAIANIPPTRRQASKFRREQGIAYRALRFARNQGMGPGNYDESLHEALTFAGLRRSRNGR